MVLHWKVSTGNVYSRVMQTPDGGSDKDVAQTIPQEKKTHSALPEMPFYSSQLVLGITRWSCNERLSQCVKSQLGAQYMLPYKQECRFLQ